jgi:hypothetical protein
MQKKEVNKNPASFQAAIKALHPAALGGRGHGVHRYAVCYDVQDPSRFVKWPIYK